MPGIVDTVASPTVRTMLFRIYALFAIVRYKHFTSFQILLQENAGKMWWVFFKTYTWMAVCQDDPVMEGIFLGVCMQTGV
jgi:hypothetical protein